jgi:hypothetical protein
MEPRMRLVESRSAVLGKGRANLYPGTSPVVSDAGRSGPCVPNQTGDVMARGWESKSVESQQSDEPLEVRPRLKEEEARRAAERESLERSRRRIATELESARSEVHRTALEHALRHLDDELQKL